MATAAIEPRADLKALTGIRGIAAWLVVLYHVRLGAAWALPEPVMAALAKGYLAVDLFFMLSGFVLWLNYADRVRTGGLAQVPNFLARRIARIWPLHLFMLAGAMAFVLAVAASGRPPSDHYPWSELPLHIAMIQNWGFTSALTWNDPAWSISCEFAAYLMFPFLVLAADWKRLSTPALVAMLLLLATGLHLLMRFYGAPTLGADIPRFGLPRALIEFTMGTVLCVLWSRYRGQARAAASVCAGLFAAAAIGWAAGLPETWIVPIGGAALLLGVALAGDGPRNPLSWRPIHYLGEISYSTYLGHFLLFIAFKLVLIEDTTRVPLELIGLFLLLMLVASMLLHLLVERPAQRRFNRGFDQLLKPRGAKTSSAGLA
jgi:peptidoglycan/LPS O-acetylase OafA/YrhL